MTKSLSEIISATQTLLLDDGTRFSTATVTAACRLALRDFNIAAPVNAGEIVDAVSSQYEYPLNTAAFATLLNVHDVLLLGTDSAADQHTPLKFDFYFEDNAPFIRLRTPQSDGQYLIVRYTIPNTIGGLDSAIESTIRAYWDSTIIDGTCYYSCLIRSAGRIETINLNQNVPDTLQNTLAFYRSAFQSGLAQAARQSAPTIKPDTHAWTV
jgi:hypothetical protein